MSGTCLRVCGLMYACWLMRINIFYMRPLLLWNKLQNRTCFPQCVTNAQWRSRNSTSVGRRAGESESKSESGSADVDYFGRSRNCSRWKFDEFDSGPESQHYTFGKMSIHHHPVNAETWAAMEERDVTIVMLRKYVGVNQERHSVIELRLINGIGSISKNMKLVC